MSEGYVPNKDDIQRMEKELDEYHKFAEGLDHPPTFFEWQKYYKS